MEETLKEQQASVVVPGKSKLRYPLRSATKAKEEKPPVSELSNSAASKRGKPASSVSKSVGVLDLSGKDKSAKPPRRLSVPAKSLVTSAAKPAANITPISEARTKRSTNNQGKIETPLSDVSRTSNRKKFNMLSSASYWLSQIKLSESAVKHSISLGFFKLALEAGCEPLQRMTDELKSYVKRHDDELAEIRECVNELFESYRIADNQEQLQVSESCSQVPEEGTRSSDDEVLSSSSAGNWKLRPRSLNADAAPVSRVTESAKKEITQKNTTTPRTRASQNKSTMNSRSVSGTAVQKLQKKPQRSSKQEATKEKDKIKKQGKKSAAEEGPISPSATAVAPEENKENMDAPPMEISQTD
ncbi:uncharacterized protein LOC110616816 isoform X2 [Manihot esculenta]|uniref:Uncharacterized protein n=1 Tax=Manihot esculenta TaxID=3983 RepID=A0ACB7HIF2_MANES|nr:uncharacterized protein LOC110616816 isoform X2 [Manihot esculenta]KAG8652483.1 hypothetical protein MANES_06G095400v8 [Manihot esculenta]